MCQQSVPAGQVNHPSPTEAAPHPPCHLPRLVQLLAGEAAGTADGPGQPVEESLAGELGEEPFGEPVA